MGQVKMEKEDRDYFKNGVKTLCGTELLFVGNLINDKEMQKVFDPEDLAFMKKELGQQAGAIWAKLLRELEKKDYEAAEKVLRGGGSS